MSAVIWKYPLAIEDEQIVLMPAGTHILVVQTQGEAPCLWAFVEFPHSRIFDSRIICIVGTGHPFPAEDGAHFSYIGTCQMRGGSLVWHVFEKVKEGSGHGSVPGHAAALSRLQEDQGRIKQ